MHNRLTRPGKRLVAVSASLIAAAGLAACGSSPSSAASSSTSSTTAAATAKHYTVPIYTGVAPIYTPLEVAQKEGFFTKYNITANIHQFASGRAAESSAQQLGIGMFLSADLPALEVWQKQPNLIGVAPVDTSYKQVSVVAAKGVTSAQQLKGQPVATVVGSGSEVPLLAYLEKNGINPSAVNITNLEPNGMVAALSKGEIKALAWGVPVSTDAIAQAPGSHFLMKTSKGIYQQWVILSATPKMIKQEPAAITDVLKALKAADAFMNAHPNKAASIAAQVYGYKTAQSKSLLALSTYSIAATPLFKSTLSNESNIAVKAGFIKTPVSFKTQFNPSFLRSISPSLVTAKGL